MNEPVFFLDVHCYLLLHQSLLVYCSEVVLNNRVTWLFFPFSSLFWPKHSAEVCLNDVSALVGHREVALNNCAT